MPDGSPAEMIELALDRFGLRLAGTATPIADSVLNDNFRVETNGGVRFLRIGKAGRPPLRFRLEQAASTYAAARGVPAVVPFAGSDGDTLQEVSGRLVSLSPWVEGWTLARGVIGRDGAHALGACLGLIHARFAEFQAEGLPLLRREFDWDTEAAIVSIERVREALDARDDGLFRRDLELKRELLHSGARNPGTFAGLRRQPSHGDFHERNVILAPGTFEVAAVVDWERVAVFPLAFEVWRALSFCDLFASPLLMAFVQGYRKHGSLTRGECVEGLEMFWQSTLHDVWMYSEYALHGNERVLRFESETATRLAELALVARRNQLASDLAEAFAS